ncbi:type VI secretion system protein ImpA [Burkholderia ubonensis]|uniref:type VI secretion system protein TssA n=1 Tax=Burkholderia ubonensis TaxID=101571 RepID=UPI000752A219|nr:type VI secretion system protein TssA [Burkholderia ubonensis]KWC31118.1 type VI secretion system protein ImpA [Burkholderia ubonensis]KWC35495.1 type VI secretion system protein ImpA [Burkholderia ubonensis]
MGMSELRRADGAAPGARPPMDFDALAVLGRSDVDPAVPAGTGVRADARFDALHAELTKLASPGASGHVDWCAVLNLAAGLLRERGKDLLVACYLAGALLQLGGAAGLRCGLEVVGDLVERHWDAMSPPVSRMRARRGALQWLLDRVDGMRDAPCDGAYAADLVEQLRAAARRLDALLAQRDDDAPTMRAINAFANRLPVESGDSNETNETKVSGAMGEFSASVAAPKVEHAPAEPTGRLASRANADAAHQPTSLADAADRERALADALAQLHRIATAFSQAHLADVRGFRLRRFACWSSVHTLPDTEEGSGRTQLAAPNAKVVDVAKGIDEHSEPADAVRFAEEQAQAFPLWLDLQRIAARALARMDGDCTDAQREVEAAVHALLARLPGLDSLKFADGTPFADDATRAWLAGLCAPGGAAKVASIPPSSPVALAPQLPPSTTGQPELARRDAHVDDTVDHACVLAASGQFDLALDAIQQMIDRAPSAERRLKARILLCELARDHWSHEIPDAFARSVIEPIRRHDLLEWNPELALDGLCAAYTLLIRQDRDSASARAVLDEIAGVDAARAMRLSM